MSFFFHDSDDDDDNDVAKGLSISRVFSENSRTNNDNKKTNRQSVSAYCNKE